MYDKLSQQLSNSPSYRRNAENIAQTSSAPVDYSKCLL